MRACPLSRAQWGAAGCLARDRPGCSWSATSQGLTYHSHTWQQAGQQGELTVLARRCSGSRPALSMTAACRPLTPPALRLQNVNASSADAQVASIANRTSHAPDPCSLAMQPALRSYAPSVWASVYSNEGP